MPDPDVPLAGRLRVGDLGPAGGIPPYELDKVIGRTTLKPLHEDDFLTFDVLSKPDAEFARS